jgi:hypothetical protein
MLKDINPKWTAKHLDVEKSTVYQVSYTIMYTKAKSPIVGEYNRLTGIKS